MKPTRGNLKQITTKPGCYIYRDMKNEILYVGKAVNLKNRVNSYFARKATLEPKISAMVSKIEDIELVTVDSEVEALILETNLIKKYKPKYNRMMKDDKNYIYIMFDNSSPFPTPQIVREKKVKGATYFGPYPSPFPARKVLRRLRRLFPYCEMNFKKIKVGENEYKGGEKRACLDYHIGLCNGVCAGLVTQREYRRNINKIKQFFRGDKYKLVFSLTKEMKKASQDLEFEKAKEIRDRIRDLEYVTQRVRVDLDTDENVLISLKNVTQYRSILGLVKRLDISLLQKSYDSLSSTIKGLEQFRIECYDISNIQGKQATGSMVVFKGGRASKSDYRKFKIRTKDTPDDFLMMKEVLKRRFKRSSSRDKSFSEIPHLIIIDGGKGQLSSARKILEEFSLLDQVPIVGLAKKEEELFRVTEDNSFKKTRLPRRSDAFYLIQRIRDEAHRFAIGYHRKLRSRAQNKSILDDIPGVGDLTKKRLITAFGSIDGIKKASRRDLQTIIKNKRTVEAMTKLLATEK